MKVLLVEDYESNIEALSIVIARVFGKYYPGFSKESLAVATTYAGAESKLEAAVGDAAYGFVLLDNGIPAFEGAHYNKRGYELIDAIKARSPGTVIIGTSNFDKESKERLPKPHYSIDKGSAGEELEKILSGLNVPQPAGT